MRGFLIMRSARRDRLKRSVRHLDHLSCIWFQAHRMCSTFPTCHAGRGSVGLTWRAETLLRVSSWEAKVNQPCQEFPVHRQTTSPNGAEVPFGAVLRSQMRSPPLFGAPISGVMPNKLAKQTLSTNAADHSFKLYKALVRDFPSLLGAKEVVFWDKARNPCTVIVVGIDISWGSAHCGGRLHKKQGTC